MKRAITCVFIFALMIVFGAGSTLAADRKKNRDRNKDGSCRSSIGVSQDEFTLAAGQQKRIRTRDRDRSCRADAVTLQKPFDLAAQKTQARKRNRSC